MSDPTTDAPSAPGLFGRLPTPAHLIARHSLTLEGLPRLLDQHGLPLYKAGLTGTGGVNSTPLITAMGLTNLGKKGNATYPNCISAAIAHGKQVVTTRTGAALAGHPGRRQPTSD